MVIHTWGFVDTRPSSPWTKIELRAERGAILRVSGTTYSAAMACLARVRSALQSLEVRWPGKALTLHVHPACNAAQLAQLDLPEKHSDTSSTQENCTCIGQKGQLIGPPTHGSWPP